MKKILSLLALSSVSISNVFAVSLAPSNADIRLDETTRSRTVDFGLDSQIEKLEGKEGFLKARIKLNKQAKKLLKTNTKTIFIPYTKEGNVQVSLPVTFSLKDGASIDQAQTVSYKVVFPKKVRKRFGLENFVSNINLDLVDLESEGTGVAVHGFVTLPSLGASTSSRDKKARIIPFAEGSSEAAGAPVKVYPVDESGDPDKSGEPIAEGVVDEKGEFNIQLPPPTGDMKFVPGPELVVEVEGLEGGSSSMHSYIDEEEVVVDPRSEFVFQEIGQAMKNDEVDQENLNATEIKEFHEKVDEMNQNDELTIDATVDKLIDNVGPLVDNIMPALNDEEKEPEEFDYKNFDIKDFNPDDAIFTNPDRVIPEVLLNALGVAGVYNVAFYYGIVGAELQSIVAQYGKATLSKPTETGVIDAVPEFRLRSEAMFVNQANFGGTPPAEDDAGDGQPGDGKPGDGQPGNGNANGSAPDPCYELTAVTDKPSAAFDGFEGGKDGEGEGGGLFFTVDELGVISVIESESVEAIGPDEVWKFTSNVTDFLPVGTGMYLGTNIKTGGAFNSVDDSYKFGLEHNTGFSIMMKKSDLQVEDLASQYGMVGFESVYETGGKLSLKTKFGYLDRTGEEASYNFNNVSLVREAPVDKNLCSEMVVSSSSEVETGTGTLKINSEGTIIISGEDEAAKSNKRNFFEGYVRPDAGILTFISYEDIAEDGKSLEPSGDEREFQSVVKGGRTIHFGVELSETLPDLTGTSFEMHSYEVVLDETGNVRIETPVSGSRNPLGFNGTNVTIGSATDHVAEGDSTTVPTKTQEASAGGSGTVTYGVDGSMSFNINGRTYQGFVAKDKSAVILVSHSEGNKMGIHFCTKALIPEQ